MAGVIFDQFGNLYGTTEFGGTPNGGGTGTVYELTPGADGWAETVLLAFNPAQGLSNPKGMLSFDLVGNLYSTAYAGGKSGLGGVFRFNPKNGVERGMAFSGSDGAEPSAGLLLNTQTSSVYGTTASGFSGENGGVFKLGPTGKQTILYAFCQQANCADGAAPYAGLNSISGNLYGTTQMGGAYAFGVVFEVTP